jgi:FAD/FMN-containing dehydrogenase
MNRRNFCRSAFAAGSIVTLASQQVLSAALHAMTTVTAAVRAVTGDGKEIALEPAALHELGASLRGPMMMPGNAGYDDARKVWNAMIDKHPALIVQCEGVTDVVNAVNFAREHELLVSVRSGGHSISGKSVCEGGMMIDMSGLNTVRADPKTRTASVDGGCLEGHIDHESQQFGLVTTAGVVSHTGAAGLTLGGGFGRVCRHFGMACDNVLSVDIITADGQWRHASPEENAELFWALRGGGGNFGVVTAFEFQLHPMDTTVIAGDIVWSDKDVRKVLEFYGEKGDEMPEPLNMNLNVQGTPEGDRVVSIEVVWSGSHDKAEAVLAPLRKLGKPIADTVAPVKYALFQQRHDTTNRHGIYSYMKSSFINEMPTDLVDQVMEAGRPDAPYRIFFMQAGGAVRKLGPSDTAFPHRAAHSNMMVISHWDGPIDPDANIAAVRSAWTKLEPYTSGFYVNLMDASDKKTTANYGDNYARLVKVKNQYDPTNLFRLNANIKPTV